MSLRDGDDLFSQIEQGVRIGADRLAAEHAAGEHDDSPREFCPACKAETEEQRT